MKAVFLVKPGKSEVRDIPEPQISSADDVKIKVAYSSICGDDMRQWKGDVLTSTLKPIGHEMVGTIVACGGAARKMGFQIGDRVSGSPFLSCGACHYCSNGLSHLCNNMQMLPGSMAEYIVWKASQLFKVPDNVSTISACLSEPLMCCMHAIDISDIQQGDPVMIIGGGTGLILLQLAVLKGASRITVVEPIESKRRLALQLGAEHVIDPLNENVLERASKITGTFGYRTILEASGVSSEMEFAVAMLAKGGGLTVFSMYGKDSSFPVDFLQLSYKELTIRASYLVPRILPRTVEMLPKLQLEPLATKIISFPNAQEAFSAHMTGLHPRVLLQL